MSTQLETTVAGAGSGAGDADLTLARMFDRTARRSPERTVMQVKRDGSYRDISYGELKQQITEFAAALLEHGIQPGDRIALISENRPEWVIADMGAQHVRAADVPIYPTLTPHQTAYIVNDAGARLAVVSNAKHLHKLLEVQDELKTIEGIIVFDDPGEVKSGKPILTLKDLLQKGRDVLAKQQAELDRRVAQARPEDLATIIYTSGTTGEPKGAMLTNNNLVTNAMAITTILGWSPDDIQLSFLPLCHVFERTVCNANLNAGSTIAYAESFETVAANMAEVRPTVVPSVPRLYEKLHARVLEGAEKGSFLKQKIFRWAMGVGRRRREAQQRYGGLPPLLEMEVKLADALVFNKLRERLGGRIRLFISGAAPLRKDIAEFFLDAGLTLLEAYGLTETSPAVSGNRIDNIKVGTVGPAIPDCEIRIAEDGEILVRGPNVMKGYWNKPEATAEAIDPQGWFHTGDIGELDADGFLRITDRKKELLVLSNGKKVAPQPIESLLKSAPQIEQAMIIGDNRNFISALIVPAFDQLKTWAARQGLPEEPAELVTRPEVHEHYEGAVAKINEELARYEQIKQFVVLEREFSQEQNELTPTLKIKRRVILEHFQDRIEGMYAGHAPVAH